jgi:hypothetical protein
MTPKEFLWCGEGDLNPHQIAPASTSSKFPEVGSVPKTSKRLIFHVRPFRSGPVSYTRNELTFIRRRTVGPVLVDQSRRVVI